VNERKQKHSGAHSLTKTKLQPNAAGFTQQSTTNLISPAVWTAVSPVLIVLNGQNAVTNAISGTRQFYGLDQ